MSEWVIWLALAGILVILEIFTGTFYLLMLGLGFAAGGIAALAGAAPTAQFLVAAVVGTVATLVLQRVRPKQSSLSAASDPNVNIDIGQSVTIDKWKNADSANPTARISYRGAMWDVEPVPGAAIRSGRYFIAEVRGSCLLVAEHAHNNN